MDTKGADDKALDDDEEEIEAMAMERLKQQRAKAVRESLARRLREVKTDEEVRPPVIPDSNYHLFLSHVWSTAQDQMRVVKHRLLEMIPALVVFLDVDQAHPSFGEAQKLYGELMQTLCATLPESLDSGV